LTSLVRNQSNKNQTSNKELEKQYHDQLIKMGFKSHEIYKKLRFNKNNFDDTLEALLSHRKKDGKSRRDKTDTSQPSNATLFDFVMPKLASEKKGPTEYLSKSDEDDEMLNYVLEMSKNQTQYSSSDLNIHEYSYEKLNKKHQIQQNKTKENRGQDEKQQRYRQEEKQNRFRQDEKQQRYRQEEKQQNRYRQDEKQDRYRQDEKQDRYRQEEKQQRYRQDEKQDRYQQNEKQNRYRQDEKQKKYRQDENQLKYRQEEKQQRYRQDEKQQRYPQEEKQQRYRQEENQQKYRQEENQQKYRQEEKQQKYRQEENQQKYRQDEKQQKVVTNSEQNYFQSNKNGRNFQNNKKEKQNINYNKKHPNQQFYQPPFIRSSSNLNPVVAEFQSKMNLDETSNQFFRGENVFARYWQDKQFYEARIINIHPMKPLAVIEFLGYGNLEEVNFKDIKKITSSNQMK